MQIRFSDAAALINSAMRILFRYVADSIISAFVADISSRIIMPRLAVLINRLLSFTRLNGGQIFLARDLQIEHGVPQRDSRMSSSRGSCDSTDATAAYDEVVLDPTLSANNFSDLLWIPHDQHKISRIHDDDYRDIGVNPRHFQTGIAYHNLCEPFLLRLGLYQVSQMDNIHIDPSLLAALVERWRPETHSFHLPVGEMTITLQDVSCLWTLPIMGLPVTGPSNGTWSILVDQLLGDGAASAVLKRKKGSGLNDEDEVCMTSRYVINLKELRNRFAVMPNTQPGEPTKEQVRQYTRAYVLDLFGSILFADSSGDSVSAMYLQFLHNLDSPDQYNWGGAVLAYLYRSLCIAVKRKTKIMSGPTVLLQHWCWSRFPTGCPRPLHIWTPNWGVPDAQKCPAFGEKWCCLHDYRAGHHRSGVSYFRNELQKLEDYMVKWEPYKEMLDQIPSQLPSRVHEESGVWLARVPLVHFWIIEHHYPDRVMRQLGYSQLIPPPLSLPEVDVCRLHKFVQSANMGRTNWSIVHQTYINEASNPANHLVVPTGYWSHHEILPYRRWFQDYCMFNIFLGKRCIEGLDDPIPEYRDEVGEIGYIPSAPKSTRDALREIKIISAAMRLTKTKTYKKLGKFFLKASCGLLRDNGMDAKLQSMFRAADLPDNIDDISDGDDVDDQESIPDFPQDEDPNYHERWMETNDGLNDYLGIFLTRPNQIDMKSEVPITWPASVVTCTQHNKGPSQIYQGSNEFVSWDEIVGTPHAQMMSGLFDNQTYHQAPTQEAQYMGHTGPSQVYQESHDHMKLSLLVTGTQDNTGPNQIVTPRTQAVENFFGTPPYNKFYVRRKRVDKQPNRVRRYPDRVRQAPDKFTFD